jgi:hypothetical protein
MRGITRIVAIVAIVLALQLGQSSKAAAGDGEVCFGCENPCSGCVLIPEDIAWE